MQGSTTRASLLGGAILMISFSSFGVGEATEGNHATLARRDNVAFRECLQQHWPWLATGVSFVMLMGCVAVYAARLNRKLRVVLAEKDHELTCRGEAQQALLQAEQEKEAILNGLSGVMVFYLDPELRIVWANAAVEHAPGRAGQKQRGKFCYEVIHGCDSVCTACPAVAAIRTGVAQEADITAPDGRILATRSNPIKDSRGQVTGVVHLSMDVTDCREAERRQARSLRAMEGVNRLQEDLLLTESLEEKLKKVTDTAVDLMELDFCRIWVVRPGDLCDRGCIHATATDDRHVCRHREKCLHLVVSSGRYTHVDGGHRRVPIGSYKIGRIASGDEAKFLTNDVTVDPRVHNHEWAKGLGLVSFAGYKLQDLDGNPIGVLAMFAKHCVTEESDAFLVSLAETTSRVILDEQAAEELRETKRQAIEANQAKSRFLANMSHEIRTPLTAILGYADLLRESALDPSARDNYLAVVRRNGEHLLSLINDILDLSRIEAGRLSLNMQQCNVVSILADVASMMRPRASQRGNTFLVEYSGEMPETIHTDGARIRQVIVNLVGNALKFTEKGSVRMAASFLPEWRPDQSALRVDVIDTGIGIREDVLPQLFQPFFQGGETITHKFGGTGLGLAISRHIAESLGGELTVKSTLGQGSTFTLTTPTGDIQGVHMLHNSAEAIREVVEKTRLATPLELAGVRVLLAEDGPDNQELIRLLLSSAGAEVEIAENGRIAVGKAKAQSFDVILMDMNMPEMDGYAATRILRDSGLHGPILALTANAMSSDRELSLDAGCNDHLTKPIDRAQLIETVAKYARMERAGAYPPPPAMAEMQAGGLGESVSLLANDPQMATILRRFVAGLDSHVLAMRESLAQHRYEDLQRLARRLKASGGSYGYPLLTDAARTLEEAAKAHHGEWAGTSLERIAALCQAIQETYNLGCSAERATL